MKALHIGFCGVVLASLVGCSSMGLGSKRIDYKAGAQNVPALEVPPDLTAPTSDDRYKIPGGDGEAVASYSDYSKGGENASARGNGSASSVLPEVKGVKLERNGNQRWLVVAGTADTTWSVVKSFLQETGLTIKSEDQAAGIIETDWAENRAKIPQDGIRSVIGKVFDNLYSSGQRDQYRVRLERGKDGVSTEIYLTHKGMEEVVSADGNTSKWQVRPSDSEIEAEMLQRLMVRLGSTSTQAAIAVSGSAAAGANMAIGGDGTAKLQEIFDGSSVIVINDAFDKSWRRVGLAIEKSGWAVEDKDRARGFYFLRPAKVESGWLDKLQFWKDTPSASARYRVVVKDGGSACEVSVVSQEGSADEASKNLLELIYKNINQ